MTGKVRLRVIFYISPELRQRTAEKQGHRKATLVMQLSTLPSKSGDGNSSYQNSPVAIVVTTAARKNKSSSQKRRSSRGSGLFSNFTAMRRAFSLEYSQAPSDEEEYDEEDIVGDANEEESEDFRPGQFSPGSDSKRDRESARRRRQRRRWQRIAGIGLITIVVVSIVISRKRSSNKRGTTLTSSSEAASDGVCLNDPFVTLKKQSSLEGIQSGAVAADHATCSEMGVAIMRDKGGNAIDAAVTVALCLGIANPASSGLGGGAFLLVHADPPKLNNAENQPPFYDETIGHAPINATSGKVTEVIDCREVAPRAAFTEMYAEKDKLASVVGGLAVSVPGELRGLELAHARHGKLPWSDVVEPAMILARDGVEVNENLAYEIQMIANKCKANGVNFGLRALLTKGDDWDRPLQKGELLVNKKLAATLAAVMKEGSSALYSGDRATSLAKDIQNVGGIVTEEDIIQYRATLRAPVAAYDMSGFSIVGVPPPSSGGAAIVGAARFLAGYDSPLASFVDTLSTHRISEALKHAFSIRMSLSDPAYNTETVREAVSDLISGPFMELLRESTKDNSTLPLSQYGGAKWAQLKDTDGDSEAADAQEGDRRRRELARHFGYLEDHGTSHFSVVDAEGNAVAMTTSVNTYFGSLVVSPSTGLILSNTMDDFANPGRPNYFGLKPSPSNFIEPGKKPLSSMSPTMVFRKGDNDGQLGDLTLVLGASGGPKIISAVLQVLLGTIMLGKSLFEAIVHPRIHDQLIYHGAAVTTTETSKLRDGPALNVSSRTREALQRRGHALLDIDYAGTVQAIAIDLETNTLTAACDVRKGGAPAGY